MSDPNRDNAIEFIGMIKCIRTAVDRLEDIPEEVISDLEYEETIGKLDDLLNNASMYISKYIKDYDK